jgi:hypothetical protein
MVERGHDRVVRIGLQRHRRHEPLNLLGEDDAAVDAQNLIHLRAFAQAVDAAIRMRQRQVAMLGEHHVEIEVAGELFVELHALLVERDALGGSIVGPDDRRVASAGAAAKVALVQHRHIGDAVVFRQVVGGREPVNAGADNGDLVRRFERAPPPHALAVGFSHGMDERILNGGARDK